MITYRATLDVPTHTWSVVTRWITAHRRAHNIRPWQRAATARAQALLVLRWFKDATRVHLLARDAGISTATAYRYLHEAIDVIASRPGPGRGAGHGTPGGLAVRVPGRHPRADDAAARAKESLGC